ncbi:MAG TPA: hypothetical protein VFG64_07290 [Dongiaceae bacterium]|nr:hypothetical protein [Dongiaceae bacterium]
MPFNAIHEYDAATAGNNTDIGGSNIAEGCAPSGINNALRELARQVRAAVANQGGDIASAAATNIGASTGQYVRVTGTTAITSFGTVNAGTMRWVEFTGALTLTHNAASLRLPGAANIVTAAGDVGLFVSLGAGNWKCLHYGRADGLPVAFSGVLTSTDAGAGEGPDFIADRASPSPAANDLIGAFVLSGRDSGGNPVNYVKLGGQILDPADGSEDSLGYLETRIAGTPTKVINFGPGVQVGAPTGGDKGAGTLNADTDIYVDGVSIAHGVVQVVSVTNATYQTLGTIMPYDDTPPQNTEGDQVAAVAITPKNASSTLRITFTGFVGGGAASSIASAALFVDSTAGALTATGAVLTNTVFPVPLSFQYEVSAGSTSARTYKVRIGCSTASDIFLNGDGTARRYGGVALAVLKVEEILP